MPRIAGVFLVDPRGRCCSRSATSTHRVRPDQWGLVGGHVEDGEDYEPAASRARGGDRHRARRRGPRLWRAPGSTTPTATTRLPGVRRPRRPDRRRHRGGGGSAIVFVDPGDTQALDLTASAHVLPEFLDSDHYRGLTKGSPMTDEDRPSRAGSRSPPGSRGRRRRRATGSAFTGTEDGSIFRISHDGARRPGRQHRRPPARHRDRPRRPAAGLRRPPRLLRVDPPHRRGRAAGRPRSTGTG